VGKHGVVRNPAVHREVLLNCINSAQRENLYCTAVSFSPITGPKGNIEYFIQLKKEAKPCERIEEVVEKVVEEAQQKLGGKK
jgi:23S rRNA (cytidine1920-2'-O)/16S rRNA (cytidine1409-2'-O)-methyltransferase